MPHAKNGPVQLAYDVEGSGPDLLLVVGSASTRALWVLVRPQLARSFRTIAYDLRETGESSPSTPSCSWADHAADALAVLDAAGAPRAHVLGHSMGGAIAQEFALAHPERCASLTLACSWGRNDGYSKNQLALMAALTQDVASDRTLLAAIVFAGSGAATLNAIDLFEKTDLALSLGPLVPRGAMLRQWQLDATTDTLDRLPSLRLPAHVIWGAEDRLLPQPLSRQLVDAIPGAVQTRIDACGHVPMIDAPDAFVAAVTGFLERR